MAGIPSVINLATINGSNGFRISGAGPYELAGSSVASAGDVNGDGFADVIVDAPGNGWYPPYFFNDAAYVIFGRGHEDTPGASNIPTLFLDPPRDSASSPAPCSAVRRPAKRASAGNPRS